MLQRTMSCLFRSLCTTCVCRCWWSRLDVSCIGVNEHAEHAELCVHSALPRPSAARCFSCVLFGFMFWLLSSRVRIKINIHHNSLPVADESKTGFAHTPRLEGEKYKSERADEKGRLGFIQYPSLFNDPRHRTAPGTLRRPEGRQRPRRRRP